MKEINCKNRRILIIDDNKAIHKDFKKVLKGVSADSVSLAEEELAIFGASSESAKGESFEVDSAFQGQEGLEKIRQALKDGRPYAMAFVDVRMPPGWDGVETIQRIWKEYPDLQVVICTAYSDYSWQEIVKKLGETEKLLILKKPFDNIEVYQLASALTEKWDLSQQVQLKLEELERIVKQRTKQLLATNSELEEANSELAVALEEAEKADKAKSEFLANMSHEIRTPMNSVIGFAEILAEEDLTAEQKKHVCLIRQSGENLMEIINDILDFSKIEAGKMEMELSECSLASLLAMMGSLMNPSAVEKGLKFEIRTDSSLPANICTDLARLRQCLINLISNAIKFTEQGYVSLNVSLEDRNGQPFIRFDVEDTGIGIPAERQEAIFESFTQADGSTSRKYGGTGLGLAITKQLAELLGGKLTLSSKEGKGSVFSLTIPAGLDVASQPLLDKNCVIDRTDSSEENTEQPEFSGHVLVAEDVETNQMLIKILLNKMGLDVTIAADGEKALQEVQKQEFDLILMDMMMPHMNGYEATKVIRKEGITTPIIALTANAMKGDDTKCLEVGCDGYLSKPIDQAQLMQILDKHLPVKAV